MLPGNGDSVPPMVSAAHFSLVREWCVNESDSWLGKRVDRSVADEIVFRNFICSDYELEKIFADDPGSKDELFADSEFGDIFVNESPTIAFLPIYLRLGHAEFRDLGIKIIDASPTQPSDKAKLIEHFDILLSRFENFSKSAGDS